MINQKREPSRQQTIHLLPVPYEIAEHICSFCFYDKTTAEIRRLKKLISQKFYNAFYSRKYPRCDWGDDDSNHCEYWIISLSDVNVFNDPHYIHYDSGYLELFREPQFQAMNCKNCGNYKVSNTTNYSVYELDSAFEMGDMEYCSEIRSRMNERVRCECILFDK
uniref:Uncharacterized protein n=1 Tax=viral metagenome TaxID=1070528 RepID=A0A6C0DQS9_9ZZZZ